ncbi:unnamed protein product [Blepharisma stoltei]|uniref:Uncharacterized protein n=1 Tax=Blepharisma stoltei TaxID=1481888 RepID=A0AAU9JAQ6_9CILI|nr:unnamed protein product [Blepharisma stoltei]
MAKSRIRDSKVKLTIANTIFITTIESCYQFSPAILCTIVIRLALIYESINLKQVIVLSLANLIINAIIYIFGIISINIKNKFNIFSN